MGATNLEATIERALDRKLGLEGSQSLNDRFDAQDRLISDRFDAQDLTFKKILATQLTAAVQEITRTIVEIISGEGHGRK
jgi:hypothetical protein